MKLTEKIYNLFTDHPYAVGETYWQHLREAFTIAFRMYRCFVAQVIHGMFPFISPKAGTDIRAMKHFCHNHTPKEREKRRNRIIIK
jgi:hypothetical protein